MPPKYDVLERLENHRNGIIPADHAKLVERPVIVVGCYERISDDQEDESTGDRGAGVRRQAEDNRVVCKRRGWQPAAKLYRDNDLSAFKDIFRPAFEELLDDLEAGVIDGIACYNLDRFVRRPNDLERAIKIYDEAKKNGRELFFATSEGDLDLASDSGLTMARVMVAFANKSSRDTARRVAAKHQATRDEGRPVGGGRPFGWDWLRDELTIGADGLVVFGKRYHVINETEADAIRWASRALTSGASWRSIVADWNGRGLRGTRGREWVPQTVKAVMTSPRLAGWMIHHNEIAEHSKTGQLIRGQWDPILTDDEFVAMVKALRERNTGDRPQDAGRRKYLLSGVVRCAECSAKLHGNAHSGGKYFYYVCHKSRLTPDGKAGCGRVGISGHGLDAMIERLVLPRIIAASAAAELAELGTRPHQDRLVEIREEIEMLLAQHRQNALSSETVFPRVTELEHERDLLRQEQMDWRASQEQNRQAAPMTEELWWSLPTEEKRPYITRYVAAVYVKPATQRGNRFDATRVLAPIWRELPGA